MEVNFVQCVCFILKGNHGKHIDRTEDGRFTIGRGKAAQAEYRGALYHGNHPKLSAQNQGVCRRKLGVTDGQHIENMRRLW